MNIVSTEDGLTTTSGNTITVRCLDKYNVEGEDYSVVSYDTTCKPDGGWTASKGCERKVCRKASVDLFDGSQSVVSASGTYNTLVARGR